MPPSSILQVPLSPSPISQRNVGRSLSFKTQRSTSRCRLLLAVTNPLSFSILLFYTIFLHFTFFYVSDNHSRSLTIDRQRPCNEAHQQQRQTLSFPTPPSLTTNTTGLSLPPPLSKPSRWEHFSIPPMPLSYPIFVPSMPKSGTTSVWKFFRCGGIKSSHNWVRKHGDRRSTLVGLCIRDNIYHQRPPFFRCGAYDFFSDTGFINYDHDTGLDCFFPSIDGLRHIYASYPNATFLNVVRNTDAWFDSLKAWAHGSLFVRFRLCNATGFPNGQATTQDVKNFYEQHNQLIRQFVRERPSLGYLEVQLESPETAQILAKATGISETCWKDCKPDQPLCEGEALEVQ